jgi:UDP-3-O-[3-hydroxymyristoyl] glucosamine N-acyltransferase
VKTLEKKLWELAEWVGGEVIGNGQILIRGIAPIEDAGSGDITFIAHPRYLPFVRNCKASALIIGDDLVGHLPAGSRMSLLRTPEPSMAFAKILPLFANSPSFDPGVSSEARVDPSAVIAEDATVFPFVYVGRKARVGRGTVLYPGVFLGDEVQIGEQCILYPQVTVLEGCRVGNRVVLHPGVVIGSDGFGFAGRGKDRIKVLQLGSVEVGDDVEIGANTTVDRATLGRTSIGRGAKIDNLVQIGHNVLIGEHSLVIAQAGIAGSARIGQDVILAGQTGVADHVEIGDGARIGPKSGIARPVSPGSVLSGALEAFPHKDWLKVMTLLPRLPELWRAVRGLERRIAQTDQKNRKRVGRHARRKRDF